MVLPPRRPPLLALAFGAVLLADLAGVAVALARDLAGPAEAIVKGTPLNAPLVFVAVQALLVALALRGTGRGSRTASVRPRGGAPGRATRTAAAALAGLGVVSVSSGFFDGAYEAAGAGLSVAERGIQTGLVVGTVVLTAAAARLARPRRVPARTAAGAPAVGPA